MMETWDTQSLFVEAVLMRSKHSARKSQSRAAEFHLQGVPPAVPPAYSPAAGTDGGYVPFTKLYMPQTSGRST